MTGERQVDILIIGGGPAGLAAAIAAREAGCQSILVADREEAPGGILKQCIHAGFGLHTFEEELTGPEYAKRYIDKANALGIEIQCGAMVVELSGEKRAMIVSREKGLEIVQAKAVILAMGCRERPRGSLATPGSRCAGIYTAGTAQKLVNRKGLTPGKRVVILGSGDIGLIMARRMTFIGAKVLACVELMPYSAGLARNIVQCLNDFDIPLYLSHTVVDIHGEGRLEGVTIAQVDAALKPMPGTERRLDCDTLLLSVGLIPENELTRMAGVSLSPATSGAEVDEALETSAEGVFACGNVLHVHDLVDFVSEEAAHAGRSAAAYVSGVRRRRGSIPVLAGNGAAGPVPQFISRDVTEPVRLMFRPRGVYKNAKVIVERDGKPLVEKRSMIFTPGEMVSLTLEPALLRGGDSPLTVRMEEKA